MRADIIVFGTGRTLQPLPQDLAKKLQALRIGFETCSTVCNTELYKFAIICMYICDCFAHRITEPKAADLLLILHSILFLQLVNMAISVLFWFCDTCRLHADTLPLSVSLFSYIDLIPACAITPAVQAALFKPRTLIDSRVILLFSCCYDIPRQKYSTLLNDAAVPALVSPCIFVVFDIASNTERMLCSLGKPLCCSLGKPLCCRLLCYRILCCAPTAQL
jgi:hypothetical protein